MGPVNLYLLLVSGVGMMVVGAVSVVICSVRARPASRWYAAGAALWFVAVALKVVSSYALNPVVIPFLKGALPNALYVIAGSVFIGIQSSAFEIGLTLAAALVWRRLARDAATAFAIGTGAGAIEAILLGSGAVVGAVTAIVGMPGTEPVAAQLQTVASTTPLFFLAGTAERAMTIPCHVATRALVLLGVGAKRPALIFYGFLIFTLLDGVAGGAHLSGAVSAASLWWVELAVLPFAVVSVWAIRWCSKNWNSGACDCETGGPCEAIE